MKFGLDKFIPVFAKINASKNLKLESRILSCTIAWDVCSAKTNPVNQSWLEGLIKEIK